MTYICVEWKHSKSEYPIWLYSEIDDERWEVRKVEIFPDGRKGYADAMECTRATELGETKIPPLIEIAADPQFQVVEITKEQFEELWAKRRELDL